MVGEGGGVDDLDWGVFVVEGSELGFECCEGVGGCFCVEVG